MTPNSILETVVALEPPRYENRRPMIIAGLRQRYLPESYDQIPALWEQLAPYLGRIPGQLDGIAYGICFGPAGTDGSYDYLAGVEVYGGFTHARDWNHVSLPAQRYAVFSHRENASKLQETIDFIFQKWLPESDVQIPLSDGETPCFLERYTEEFNPYTGRGGMEIWVPIRSADSED